MARPQARPYTYTPIENDDYEPYDIQQLKRARLSLFQMVDQGALVWFRNKISRNSMQFFPNVWEGEHGMLEHVSDSFPMPPTDPDSQDVEAYDEIPPVYSQQLAQQATAGVATDVAGLSTTQTGEKAFDDRSEILNQKDMDEQYWLTVSRAFIKLQKASLSLSILKRAQLYSVHSQVQQDTCRQLRNLHKTLLLYRDILEDAEEKADSVSPMNVIRRMPKGMKLEFLREHNLEGALPLRLYQVTALYRKIRKRLINILTSDAIVNLPDKRILEEAIQDLVGEDHGCQHAHTDKTLEANTEADSHMEEVNYVGQDESGLGSLREKAEEKLSDKDIFEKSVIDMKRQINMAMSRVLRVGSMFSKRASLKSRIEIAKKNCEQMTRVYKKICNLNEMLAKLKMEFKGKDNLIETIMVKDDIQYAHFPDFNPEANMLETVETMLNLLKSTFMRILYNKKDILESNGFKADLKDLSFSNDPGTSLKRICFHSETLITDKKLRKMNSENDDSFISSSTFDKVSESSGVTGQSTSAANEKMEEAVDVAKSMNDMKTEDPAKSAETACSAQNNDTQALKVSVAVGQDKKIVLGSATLEHAADDVRVGSVSFVTAKGLVSLSKSKAKLKSLASISTAENSHRPNPALYPNESQLSKKEIKFIEKENHHWNRLQKLYKTMAGTSTFLQQKAKNTQKRKHVLRSMRSIYNKIKQLADKLAAEKNESTQQGYCTKVTYANLESQCSSTSSLLVWNLEQMEHQMDSLFTDFAEVVRILGLSHQF